MSKTFAAELESARASSDRLFTLLAPEALYERPIPERHRLIFYRGHLEAFDWNLIGRNTLDLASFHPTFDRLFAFGIDPEPGKQPSDRPSDWPQAREVEEYSGRIREAVDRALPDVPDQIAQVAIEHRLMHAETLAYLMHNLPFGQKRAPQSELRTAASNGHRSASNNHVMIDVPGGQATLGRPRESFGWDNEFDEHAVEVPPFRIAKYKVTNGDYLELVNVGAPPPHFWFREGGKWMYRGMFEPVPLPPDRPVYVTHDEASAYAKWVGKELPTEAQFHRAAYSTPDGGEREYPWGDALPNGSEFDGWDPVPVTATPQTNSALGVSQLLGNGWEWTATPFAPFPGFEPFPFYPGYSQDFFDGAHYVMKGASPRTARRFLRRSFRNWFRPNYPYIYATCRLVEN